MASIEDLRTAARERLGVPHLYPYQEEIVGAILQEEGNRLVVLPTGAGKSLCFTLPALFLRGLTVLVYPLLALMDDQARRFRRLGLPCALLRGGQTKVQRGALWKRLMESPPPLLLTNPEMLVQAEVCSRLADVGIDHLVFDEAHCIDQWGKSFRPAYAKAAERALDLRPKRLTALTATASPPVRETLSRLLFRGLPHTVHERLPDRPNITYEILCGPSRRVLLLALLEEAQRPLLVFVSSRMGANRTAHLIRRETGSESVRFYHAGLSKTEKKALEEWFFASDDGILVTTCAYGMGVDKSDIRTVVHWDPSESVSAYLQESGRAGRDGKPSRAILLVSPESRFRDAEDQAASANGDTCRRELLMRSLGSQPTECSGCDVCQGLPRQDGWMEYLQTLFGKRVRHRSPRSWSLLLWGRPVPDATRELLHLDPRWGALGHLSLESVEELVDSYLAQNHRKLAPSSKHDYICQNRRCPCTRRINSSTSCAT